MTDQSVGGVSVPLTIDRTGWTAGLKAARGELESFKRDAQSAGAGTTGGGHSIRGGIVAAPPLASVPQSQLPAVTNVSPRFAVSQGAIREMRVQMNQQIRQLASQGEAVQIPVKLGRVPYGAIRNELSTGIGEVPIRVTLDPSSISAIRGQITGAIGRTGGGGRVSPGQQELIKRATGGPVSPHQDVIVGDGGRPEVFRPTVPGRIMPQVTMAQTPRAMAGMQVAGRYSRSQATRGLTSQQRDFDTNIMAGAGRLQPHHIQGGIDWYRKANEYMQAMAAKYRVPVPQAAGALAALSAGTEWEANKTKFERILRAQNEGRPFPYSMNFDAHRKASAILSGQMTPERAFATSPKIGQFYRGISGDPSALVIDMWATRTATAGGMTQPGRARPGIEAAFMKGAKHTGLQPAEFQAALWLMEKEESLVPPGQMHMSFQRGGRTRQSPGQAGMGFAAKFPRSRPYCSVCGTTMANPFDHNASAQHKANLRKRDLSSAAGSGDWLTRRPRRTQSRYDDPEEEAWAREQVTSYAGGRWSPGMQGGGPTFRKLRASARSRYQRGGGEDYYQAFRDREFGHPGPAPIDPGRLTSGESGVARRERGFMYHGTSWGNMRSIARRGLLPEGGGAGYIHGTPWEDEMEDRPGSWWDKRLYGTGAWGGGAAGWAREGGDRYGKQIPHDALLRAKLGKGTRYAPSGMEEERVYGKTVPPDKLEYLGEDEGWHPITNRWGRRKMAGGGRARMRGAGYVPGLRSIAQGYNRMAGLPPMQEQMLHPLNPDFSRRTAAAYEAMPGGTDDLSRQAYKAFAEETGAQYEYLQRAGFKFEPDPGDPYSPKAGGKLTKMQLAARDVSRNKRLLAFSSALEHPLLTNEQNLMFRHVHDMMGHLTEGYSIGPRGEFNAAVKHSQMFSPLARRAMLAETHGQNSVVNFSPTVLPGYGGRSIADVNKAAPGSIYADQKARGLPENILEEFYRLTGIKKAGGGFIRSLFGRAGPSKDQLRAGYGSRLTGMAENFPSPTPGLAGLGIQYLGQALSAEQRQPNIDLNEAIKRLPDVRREFGATQKFLRQQAERVELRQAQHMEPLAGSKFEPFQNPPMLPGQGGGKTLEIKPHWLPRMGIDPTKISKNAVGGPVWDALEGPHAGVISGEAARLGEMYPGAGAPRLRTTKKGLSPRAAGAYGGGIDPEIFFREDLGGVDPAYVARHEFGHHLDATIGKKGLVARARLWNLKRQIGKNPATRYAATDRNEAFAELFARRDDPDLSPKHQGLLGKVDKLTEKYVGGPQHFMAGGPVTKTFRLADPNGLHMRNSAGFAKALESANVDISGRNLSNGQELGDPKSIYSWMTLGARQGHKIELSMSGPDAPRALKLIEQMMAFNPEKRQMGYTTFQEGLGIFAPNVSSIEARMLEEKGSLPRPRRAAGGPGRGTYIVNEIGREKFVPERLEHTIPTDVAKQLPEGGGLAARLARARGEEKPEPWKPAWMRRPSAKDLTGRAQGGVVEIPGHGARLWEAPEDGWIIPARLAGKVPGRHTGGPAEAGHTHPHRNRQGTGYQDEYGRSVPDSAIVGRTPVRDTFRGAIFGTPQQGPPVPGSSWRGAMFGSGGSNALRDSFTNALTTVFGPNGKATVQVRPAVGATTGATGRPTSPPAEFKALQAAGFQVSGRSFSSPESRDTASMNAIEQVRATRAGLRELLPEKATSAGGLNELAAQAKRDAAATRGLTGSSGVGGLLSATLGGGGARRQALAEAQGLMREYQRRTPTGTPPGVDAVTAWNDVIAEAEDKLLKFTKTGNDFKGSASDWDKELKGLAKDINIAKEAQLSASDIRLQAEKKFQQASGGAVRNIAALTTAGFAFSALSGAITTGITLATKAAQPFVDELTGFQSTATRVTQGLAGQARQLGGNVPSAIAGAAGPAGVGGAGLEFLTRTLSDSVAAKAGAAAAAEASDLFRAAAGSGRAPTGLFSGFGGVGGSSFLAEFLGGGKGFTEVLGGDVAALRGQAQGLTGVNALRGPTNVGTGRDPIGDFLLGTGTGAGGSRGLFGDIGAAVEGALGGPTAEEYGPGAQPTTPDQDAAARNLALETLTTELKDYNEAAKRGADALGEHTTGLRLATREQLGLTEATDDLQQATMRQVGEAAGDESAGKLADAGIFLVDAAGNLAQGTEQYRKFFQQSAQGRTVGTPEAFAVQQARQLEAQRQVSRIQTQRSINLEIPGQVGQQLAANPFTSAFSGIPGLASASKGLISNLEETQRLQKEITKEGQAAVEAQARDIDVQTGTRQGAQFRSYMADVTQIGSEIAGITEAISNRQAQVSFAAYSNNIRILNRSISDARGLLTGRGGAGNLGAIQRAQFDLSRQSQRLSLQSQALQLQSNQLSLELSQRQINFQKAIAGFQAPGITGQERAARMAEAELEASFAQKQLNIGVQQQGIGQQQLGISGQQFGLELKAFMVSAQRSLVDLEAQRSITVAQFQLEQEQIAAQKRIGALTIRMGERQAKAQALVQEAQGNFNSVLSAAGQQIAQFGGTAAAATKVIMAALRSGASYASAYQRAAGTYGGTNTYSNKTPHAEGYSAMASGPTSFIAGEAGPEHVLVLRNPKSGVMGPVGGGGGGGNTIQINISGNTFGGDQDPGEIARKLADEVERRFETKARLLSVSA